MAERKSTFWLCPAFLLHYNGPCGLESIQGEGNQRIHHEYRSDEQRGNTPAPEATARQQGGAPWCQLHLEEKISNKNSLRPCILSRTIKHGKRKRNLLNSWYTFSFPLNITLGNYFWNDIMHFSIQFIREWNMKLHWTAASTTECSGFLLRPIMRAAYFPLSVWGATHVPFQKQSGDCASRSGESLAFLTDEGMRIWKRFHMDFATTTDNWKNSTFLLRIKKKSTHHLC